VQAEEEQPIEPGHVGRRLQDLRHRSRLLPAV
jgi:hypothetical protein